jgi:hypothetical protein
VMEGWISKTGQSKETKIIVVCWVWWETDSCVPLVLCAQWQRTDAGFSSRILAFNKLEGCGPSFLASLPGGPSPAVIYVRGGWTMGQVKDIYFHQMQAGNKFTGWCILLLNMMSGDFATSHQHSSRKTQTRH